MGRAQVTKRRRRRERRRDGPPLPVALLGDMPAPLAPLIFKGSMYCCNRRGLHVPLETLTVEEMRRARCYFEL